MIYRIPVTCECVICIILESGNWCVKNPSNFSDILQWNCSCCLTEAYNYTGQMSGHWPGDEVYNYTGQMSGYLPEAKAYDY